MTLTRSLPFALMALTVPVLGVSASEPSPVIGPVIGDERVLVRHIAEAEAAAMPIAALSARGKRLFEARFTTLDGAGRPAATQSDVPVKRRPGETPAFFRTSGPEANSCAGCHNQPAVGGAGDFVTNVFASEGVNDPDFDSLDPQFSGERGTPPVHGAGLIELLAREMTRDLQTQRDAARREAERTGETVRAELVSKGVSFGHLTIDADGFVKTGEIEGIDQDLIVRPFSQKGVVASLRQFTINAMNTHHGMQASERFGERWTDQADFDEDGVTDELTPGDISALVAFQATLPMPGRTLPDHPVLRDAVERGARVFEEVGCADCHRPHLPLDSLAFHEPGPVNSAGTLRPEETTAAFSFSLDGTDLRRDDAGRWLVPLFSDLKRHRIADDERPHFANEMLAQRFVGRDVFLTSRLRGVGSTAPYGHRGDVTTLAEAIAHHGAEGSESRAAYEARPAEDRAAVIEFLKSLTISPGGGA